MGEYIKNVMHKHSEILFGHKKWNDDICKKIYGIGVIMLSKTSQTPKEK